MQQAFVQRSASKADSPLDWQIKSSLIADSFNLAVGLALNDAAGLLPLNVTRSHHATLPNEPKAALHTASLH